MVWRVLGRYAELAGGTVAVASGDAYAMLDGVFERALLRHLADDERALSQLQTTATTLLPSLLR
jgi:TetR/AcrR family transcriptional regulator, transcriptional repressor of bet genes